VKVTLPEQHSLSRTKFDSPLLLQLTTVAGDKYQQHSEMLKGTSVKILIKEGNGKKKYPRKLALRGIWEAGLVKEKEKFKE
jgi:hypothetical protein